MLRAECEFAIALLRMYLTRFSASVILRRYGLLVAAYV